MTMLINLLPDLRQAKLKERHRRQLVTGVSVTVWIACGAIVALLFVYMGGQKVIIATTTKSVSDKEASLQSISGLEDALTASQHLSSLSSLYAKRVYMSKFFDVYMQANPATVALSSMQIDSSNILTILGTAPSYAEVAKLARALEGSNVTVGAGAAEANAPYFSNVSILSLDNSAKTGVSFTISATLAAGVTSGSN